MLDPRPRDFTATGDLDRALILDALSKGRAGTAMKAFGALMSPAEMADVATFVLETFVACREENTRYHTPGNGWPDHESRYGAAFPFATGAIALDAPDAELDAHAMLGRALFRTTCISCHDGRLTGTGPVLAAADRIVAPAEDAAAGETTDTGHQDDYDTPTIHDIAPAIPDLTEAERRGKDLYVAACQQCHAADGSGQNWIGKFLKPNPPDFTAPDFAARFDEESIAASTLAGPEGTTMPSFGHVLSSGDAADIAAYIVRAFVRAR